MNIAKLATLLTAAFRFLRADSNGNLTANVIPRTGTLASQLALSGATGEVSVATDENAVVCQFPSGSTKAIYVEADITNGIVGKFTASTSYTMPAAGNATYANLQALITYLQSCSFTPGILVTINLGDGAHGAAAFTSPLPQVLMVPSTAVSYATLGTGTHTVAVTGSAGAWNVTLTTSVAGKFSACQVGDVIGIQSNNQSTGYLISGAHTLTGATGTTLSWTQATVQDPTATLNSNVKWVRFPVNISGISVSGPGGISPEMRNISSVSIVNVTQSAVLNLGALQFAISGASVSANSGGSIVGTSSPVISAGNSIILGSVGTPGSLTCSVIEGCANSVPLVAINYGSQLVVNALKVNAGDTAANPMVTIGSGATLTVGTTSNLRNGALGIGMSGGRGNFANLTTSSLTTTCQDSSSLPVTRFTMSANDGSIFA